MKEMKNEKRLGIFFYGCSMIAFALLLWMTFNYSIWSDEAFSLSMIKKTYFEIIYITSLDVHPPLYYILLKAWTDLIHLFLPGVNAICLGKMFSCFQILLLLIFNFTFWRRQTKWLTSGIFAIFIVMAENLPHNAIEIRMYSMGLLFVTVCFMFSYMVRKTDETKYWIMMSVSFILAAYTHYFACISVGIIFVALLFEKLFLKKSIKKWLLATTTISVLYLPWLIVAFGQIRTVQKDYWIPKIGLHTILEYMNYVIGYGKKGCIVLLCLILLTIFGLWVNKKTNRDSYLQIVGICVLCGTVLVGVAVSVATRPIFVSRYMLPAMGSFWLGISWSVSGVLQKKRKIGIVCMGILLTVLCIGFKNQLQTERNYQNQYKQIMNVIDQDKEFTLVTNYTHIQKIMTIYYPQVSSYLTTEKSENAKIKEMLYDNMFDFEQIDHITSPVMYYIQYKEGEKDTFIETCKNNKYRIKDLGEFLLEFYQPLEIYKIEKLEAQ